MITSIHCILAAIIAGSSLVQAEEIILLQGEQKQLPKSSSVWVENGAVIRVDEGTKSEIIRGIKQGQSELRMNGKTNLVQVLGIQDFRTKTHLDKVLQKTLQLKIELHDGNVFLAGRLSRLMDYEEIIQSCEAQSCKYKLTADISDEIFSNIEDLMNHRLSLFSLPKMRLDKGDFLSVHVPMKSSLKKEFQVALAPMGIAVESSSTAIELAPLIKVQITIAEVKREYLLKYGVQWPQSYSAQILPSLAGLGDSQFILAQFWEHNNAGRVLASPNIICRSGKDAEFVAGGEFPIKIINYRVQDIIWKRYGIVLKVSPVADFSGRMSISLETEVSSIDKSRTVDGIPGLYTNRVQTHFDLTKPRTIALSGLIKSEDSKVVEGWPSLSEIPILGPLFSSRDFSENKTELVIFVRPEIINPEATGEEPILPAEIQTLAKKFGHQVR